MFQGDDPTLRAALTGAIAAARALGHPRVGSEHLLLALARPDTRIAATLSRHGASPEAIREAARTVAPHGAGVAADQALIATLGISLILEPPLAPALGTPFAPTGSTSEPDLAPTLAPTEHPVGRPPRFPLGAARARRRLARLDPPLGADAQAAYEASLRLALARRATSHRPEHLALALTCLDPGVAWILEAIGADRSVLLADLAAAFPASSRPSSRTRTRTRPRHRDLARRYQNRTGRAVVDSAFLAALLG